WHSMAVLPLMNHLADDCCCDLAKRLIQQSSVQGDVMANIFMPTTPSTMGVEPWTIILHTGEVEQAIREGGIEEQSIEVIEDVVRRPVLSNGRFHGGEGSRVEDFCIVRNRSGSPEKS